MIFKEISIVEYKDDIVNLLSDHHFEVYGNREFNPNIKNYETLESANMLFTIGCFEGSKIVGYSCNIITNSFNDLNILLCQNILIYLDKKSRLGMNGVNLIKRTMELAKTRGASCFRVSAPPGSRIEKMLGVIRFTKFETTYQKELNHG